MSDRVYPVLVADDSDDEVTLLRRAFRQADRLRIAHHSPNGQDAIAYLRGEAKYADRHQFPYPDLLLLDLKMPACDGFDVLQWLANRSLPRFHIVVLSNSNALRDMRRALALGADYYQIKPRTLDELQRLSELLQRSCMLFQQSVPRPRSDRPAVTAPASGF